MHEVTPERRIDLVPAHAHERAALEIGIRERRSRQRHTEPRFGRREHQVVILEAAILRARLERNAERTEPGTPVEQCGVAAGVSRRVTGPRQSANMAMASVKNA